MVLKYSATHYKGGFTALCAFVVRAATQSKQGLGSDPRGRNSSSLPLQPLGPVPCSLPSLQLLEMPVTRVQDRLIGNRKQR